MKDVLKGIMGGKRARAKKRIRMLEDLKGIFRDYEEKNGEQSGLENRVTWCPKPTARQNTYDDYSRVLKVFLHA